ncbi:MAG: Gfo/Idh/MocA family oxidoreductase [Myxococcota bacterium]
MRVAIVGCGVMGRRHAATVAGDPHSRVVAAVDIVPERASAVVSEHGGVAAADVPREVDAVIVATPTATHAEVARPLLARGIPCLVEKPLAASSAMAQHLVGPRCFVGHIERFNPALVQAGTIAPRVVVGRRVAPPTGRSSDIDVVLDLMIHDLDLLIEWSGQAAWRVVDATGLGEGALDTASVQLRSEAGHFASLLASRVADKKERVLHCYEPGRYTRLDLVEGRCHQVYGTLKPPTTSIVHRDALAAQWAAFRAAVRGETRPWATSGEAGARAVQLAEHIQEAVRS